MGDWQLTATTIYCDAVDDDVTIIVYSDWKTRCTGFFKYSEESGNPKLLAKKSQQLKRSLRCEGPLDSRVTNYRDKLVKEEAAGAGK
jgi:hypothetical protein